MTTDDAPRPALDAATLVYAARSAIDRYGAAQYRQGLAASSPSVHSRRQAESYAARAQAHAAVDALLDAAASERDALAWEAARYKAALPSPCPEHGIDHMGLTRRWGWLRPDVESASVWACHHEGVPGESDCGFWHQITTEGYAALASQEGATDGR